MNRFHQLLPKIRIETYLLRGFALLAGLSSIFVSQIFVSQISAGQVAAGPSEQPEQPDQQVASEMLVAASQAIVTSSEPIQVISNSSQRCSNDRVFWLSSRHLASEACRANLQTPGLRMWQMDCGRFHSTSPKAFHATLSINRPVVIYVHGNRMSADDLVDRSTTVRSAIRRCCQGAGIDWVIYSWPSDQDFGGLRDFRVKADRCDAQGLYLAKFLQPIAAAAVPTGMIGFSFGSRVVTGSLHALAGGRLAGRQIPGPTQSGASVKVGLIAPALESTWLMSGDYHGRATKNMEQLLLLYNRRDAVLKRYWLIEKVRRETALGFSGPSRFGPRLDGTPLPVRSRDCSPSVKLRHAELDYYQARCNAGSDMARLIRELEIAGNHAGGS